MLVTTLSSYFVMVLPSAVKV
jgi:hypothetical protein